MNRLMSPLRSQSRWALWLLGVALLVRALMPTGWMTSTQQGQWISICSGKGVATAWLDADGTLQSESDDKQQHDEGDAHCVFSSLSFGIGLPVMAKLVLSPLTLNPAPAFRPLAQSVGQGLAAPPPPKTGPPVLI